MERYRIITGETAPCELLASVNGIEWRKVCEGTYTYCARMKAELEDRVDD